ncbi:MAG: hypothetical protein HY307_00980 [Arcobacter sp.]|nr:hypothetical protein [Arcobacter sp.]
MTNQETIEKLNDALNHLIDAYEALQLKNDETNEKLTEQIAKNRELEFQLSDVNTTIDKRENKMDGMLNKIHKLLSSPKTDMADSSSEYKEEFNDSIYSSGSILDIKLDNKVEDKANKIDLGRMESLLNGLNK